jgi:hypothetical protein
VAATFPNHHQAVFVCVDYLIRLLDHAGGRLLDLSERGRRGGEEEKKEEKGEGKKGRCSFNIERSDIVFLLLSWCLSVLLLKRKRLSFLFTLCILQPKSMKGNRQYRRKYTCMTKVAALLKDMYERV